MTPNIRCIINSLSVNRKGVIASGGDNGSLWFWDSKEMSCLQKQQTIAYPGSLEAETGIFALTFDMTGTRVVTCEADKTIKLWKQK